MKKIWILLILLIGCGAEKGNNIHNMMDRTVIILDRDEDGAPSICAGVWISRREILTAKHCVSGNNVKYFSKGWNGDEHIAIVVKKSENVDLVLLKTLDKADGHGYAEIYLGDIRVGDDVEIMGHPAGMMFSYLIGNVSAKREVRGARMLRISMNGYFGNSGGGAFKDGKLVGICSLKKNDVNMFFFLGKEEIMEFLQKSF